MQPLTQRPPTTRLPVVCQLSMTSTQFVAFIYILYIFFDMQIFVWLINYLVRVHLLATTICHIVTICHQYYVRATQCDVTTRNVEGIYACISSLCCFIVYTHTYVNTCVRHEPVHSCACMLMIKDDTCYIPGQQMAHIIIYTGARNSAL